MRSTAEAYHQIGYQHGRAAADEIKRGLTFYEDLFKLTTKLNWEEVTQTAVKFLPLLQRDWSHYLDELEGMQHGIFIKCIRYVIKRLIWSNVVGCFGHH